MNAFGYIKGFVTLCDALKTIEEANTIYRDQKTQPDLERIRCASVVNKLVLLGFNLAEITCLKAGCTSETLMNLKAVEVFPRWTNMFIQFFKAIGERCAKPNDLLVSDVVGVLESGVMIPFIEFIQTLAECDAYYEKHFIELPPEKLAQATRPVFGPNEDGDRVRVIGAKHVSLEECRANLQLEESRVELAEKIRMANHLGIKLENACGGTYSLKNNLYALLAGIFELNGKKITSERYLLSLDYIPTALHNDVVLSKYCDPISLLPIRYPVGDPTSKNLQGKMEIYERDTIVRWLSINPISPTTNQPLNVGMLAERPGIQALIDSRLKLHSAFLWEYVQQSLATNIIGNLPADQVLQQQADKE